MKDQHDNLVICVHTGNDHKGFSVLMTDMIPDLHLAGNSQCFPLYLYEEAKVRTDKEKAKEQEYIATHYQQKADLTLNRKKRDGVVVTPVEVVDFQIRSVIEQTKKQYGLDPDEGVLWIDPFGGSGIYTARLLQIVDLPPERKFKLAEMCIVIEIDAYAAQVAANNLANVILEETGIESYVRVLNSDTFVIESNDQFFDGSISEIFPNDQKLWSYREKGAA
jgi:predicted helicase